MNIAEYSIKNSVISGMFALLLLIGGALSFTKLGQLEFPEFTLKTALVVTAYPGASPVQVEEEVTLQLEEAIQQLPYVDNVRSVNSAGLSQIIVDMKMRYRKKDLAQIWDELRRKVNDLQNALPPGSRPPTVIDDFADVYGILYTITGEGFTNKEITNYLDYLRRELTLISGVSKVAVKGQVEEKIYIEISRQKLANLNLDINQIIQLVSRQNVVSHAGEMFNGIESFRISPTGEYNQIEDLKHLVVGGQQGKLIYLSDVADVKRDYVETPKNLYHANGTEAVSLGISFLAGTNVVDTGKLISEKMLALESERPIGIEIQTVYNQPEIVEKSVSGFIWNLISAIAIVIAVLLIFMGVRSGVLMGLILLLTILGTFIIMQIAGINLQLISLGALIIALGMLVDNAIVVTEGILIGLKRGMTKLEASKQVVTNNIWPLLGATFIAITAFAPIGLSPDASGEFAGSLFWVLCISLMLSWVTAITLTPYFANMFFQETDDSDNGEDPYQGALFTVYKNVLDWALNNRKATMAGISILLLSAIVAFGFVKQLFFPASTTPIYFVDYWLPPSTDIRTTTKEISRLEKQVLKLEEVKQITATIGQGAQRFVLPYNPEKEYRNYAQLIVEAPDLEAMEAAMAKTIKILRADHPQANYKVEKMKNGPAAAATLEVRFSGPDTLVLRELAAQAEEVFSSDPWTESVRHDWQQRTKVVRPQFMEVPARKAGITKGDLDNSLLIAFSGQELQGTKYRQGSDLLPVVIRSPAEERLMPSSIESLQVWSPEYKTYVPISQVVGEFKTSWEDPVINRRDRLRTISVLGEPLPLSGQTADSILKRLMPKVNAIELPDGYSMEWGGEYEKSTEAKQALFKPLPIGLLAMFMVTLFLFSSRRKALVIWATVPLSIIGVSYGLLIMGAPFGFMALLGMLSLSGMLIKNGIVLVEQIKLEQEEGKDDYEALVHASVSRVRPVSMAAITTMLGMIPLFFDAFFQSMAVTITFGLGFGTVLTLIILPVLYAIVYRIEMPKTQH